MLVCLSGESYDKPDWRKINFGTFQVLLDDINAENIAKLKLAYVGWLIFVCSVKPKEIVLV